MLARLFLGAIVSFATVAGCGSESRPELGLGYDPANKQILVSFGRALEGGETLHVRLRRGEISKLNCTSEGAGIGRVDSSPHESFANTWRGPLANDAMFETLYDDSWLEGEPTAEMLEEARLGLHVIDVCLMDGSSVVRQTAFDIRRALDNDGGDGKFDGGDEERIESTVAYAEACVAELGEIPFFKKVAAGDYETYNCLDSTIIPTTVTDAAGNVCHPEKEVDQCDELQYLTTTCEASAVSGRINGPRVTSATNDEGTSWVLLCRKSGDAEGTYNDIAMIGSNPFTGKTCFFQNALFARNDGLHVPHPADKFNSSGSPEQSETIWDGIHGGNGSGIQCASCHSTDPFIHTPWIDGAVNALGDTVVPKMGEHDDFVLGYNEAPYSIVNASGQGWSMPKQLVSKEAQACTRCHRIGDGRWTTDWIDRLIGESANWTSKTTEAYRSFKHTFWMPPDLDGVDASSWQDSDAGKAIAFIKACGDDPSSCDWKRLPTDPISDDGALPEISLDGNALSTEAGLILGARVSDPRCPGGDCRSRRCAECHSVSSVGIRSWDKLTKAALNECNLSKNPAEMSTSEAMSAINCMRADPDDPSSVFASQKLGILSTGVQYTDFRRLFQKGFGDKWQRPYATFKARVSMPKGNHPKLSQREFATLIKFFADDMPNLDSVWREAPPPATCNESWNDGAISSHLSAMAFDGWAARNSDAGMRMQGCSLGADPTTCFSSKPSRTGAWGKGVGTIRELVEFDFSTSFWTRSSADGRYIGNGGGQHGSTITDLQTGRDIGVKASYDPGFFPDNSGFMFQGATGGAGICNQNVLASGGVIDFTESGCVTAANVNLYQHVARGTGGGDYFIINSQFTSDPAKSAADPAAPFNEDSTMKFTPMFQNGTSYEPMDQVIVRSPFEGDSVLSPSAELVASRLAGPGGKSHGYVIRRVQTTRNGAGYDVSINQELATVCMPGAKANFSFDERFIVTHFYRDDRADIMLLDLVTHKRIELTNMPSGDYAQFPHFRSDGWIYFLVIDGDEQYVAASDAAIRLAN